MDMEAADAEAALSDWKRRTENASTERDGLVRTAREAGLSIYRISQLSGLTRTTIYKILDTASSP